MSETWDGDVVTSRRDVRHTYNLAPVHYNAADKHEGIYKSRRRPGINDASSAAARLLLRAGDDADRRRMLPPDGG